jgi:endonuclease YncB( thermonuclease family)
VRHPIAIIALLAAALPAAGANLEGLACVADGDTIVIGGRMAGRNGGCSGGTRVRLFGIDAVELDQACRRADTEWPCGKEAMIALEKAMGGKQVVCAQKDRDQFGTIVAICRADRIELNLHMVANGWAVALLHVTTAYEAAEAEARRERRGIWAGDFENPAEWRRRRGRQ